MAEYSKRLWGLPNEILIQILQHVSPEDNLSVRRVCKVLSRVADEPTLWRHYCINYYEYWGRRHQFAKKLQSPAADTDWKQLFRSRREGDSVVEGEFEGILRTTVGRIPRIEKIADFGRDARVVLQNHINGGDDTEMPLARDFWSSEVLLRIGRAEAVDLWTRLAGGETMDHALALSAYDAFATADQPMSDLEDIDARLQSLADEVRTSNPDWEHLYTRSRARRLLDFLHEQGFRGVREDEEYHALLHNFIGCALRSEEHNALPLICAAIYCSIARRLGLKAELISYPLHVYVNVQAPMGVDLQGKPSKTVELTQGEYEKIEPAPNVLYKVRDGTNIVYRCIADGMYVDAFRPQSEEVSIDVLKQNLTRLGVTPPHHGSYLRPCSTRELVLRTRNNIIQSLRAEVQAGNAGQSYFATRLIELAYYATVWVHLLVPSAADTEWNNTLIAQRRHSLPALCNQLTQNFPWDVGLVERHILPAFRNLPEYNALQDLLQTQRFQDLGEPTKCNRYAFGIERKVTYKVGQVFTHRRYGYTGMIIGWDTSCKQDEDWISQMRVDSLSGGRMQSFYNVITDDCSNRYVAQENIELTTDKPSEMMMKMAGRYFKRWDEEQGRFISNITDIYPDD